MLSKLQNISYPSLESVQTLLIPPPVPTGDELIDWKNEIEYDLSEMASSGCTRYFEIIFRELPVEEAFNVSATNSHHYKTLQEWYQENQKRLEKQNVPIYDTATLIQQEWIEILLQRYMDFWTMHSDVPVSICIDNLVWGLKFDWTKKRKVE